MKRIGNVWIFSFLIHQIWFNQQSACGSFPHHEAPSAPVPEAYVRLQETKEVFNESESDDQAVRNLLKDRLDGFNPDSSCMVGQAEMDRRTGVITATLFLYNGRQGMSGSQYSVATSARAALPASQTEFRVSLFVGGNFGFYHE